MKDAGTFGISGMAGPGYVRLRELAKAASARKSKHPKGFKCHHTFRIGAELLMLAGELRLFECILNSPPFTCEYWEGVTLLRESGEGAT
jgi:hypothetical protein